MRQHWWNQESRAARREYRRSLPSSYRWRRVMVVLWSIACVALVLNVTGNNPVAFMKERLRDATVDLAPIGGVSAAARPQGSVASSYNVEKLPGPREEAWATTWPAGATAEKQCWETPAAGTIVLRWEEPTRVRGLDVWAGLDADNSERARQFLPKWLGVLFGDLCVIVNLESTPERQRLLFDTRTEVTSLRITVGDVYPNSATPAVNLVAIGGLDVLHQPG